MHSFSNLLSRTYYNYVINHCNYLYVILLLAWHCGRCCLIPVSAQGSQHTCLKLETGWGRQLSFNIGEVWTVLGETEPCEDHDGKIEPNTGIVCLTGQKSPVPSLLPPPNTVPSSAPPGCSSPFPSAVVSPPASSLSSVTKCPCIFFYLKPLRRNRNLS